MIHNVGKYRFREVCFRAHKCILYRVYLACEDHIGVYISLLESGEWVEHKSLRPDDVRVIFLMDDAHYARTEQEKILSLLMGREYG